ncbi:T9SS type B sorting domain-containing protein [Eudoraea chungangensis]|uniref:T9SS type B sorting domain-containing protein n=1 Tax=Eudoraea chungangensis TaxID=1481905 RepID=UPI0023EBE200|nr:T9SS type B sorting domain-containing protein [Eudoraea chungangensis]
MNQKNSRKNLLKFFFLFLLVGCHFWASSQEAVPFTPRLNGGNIEIRGDIIFVGNNILNRASETNPGQANTPYNGTQNNNSLWMEYIDIDGDPSTFSSSSAELTLNDPNCSQVRYAGLYWAATYPNERSTNGSQPFSGTPRIEDWNNIKFRIPGGSYVDLTADTNADPVGDEDDIIFDGYDYTNINNSFKDSPYICYKNVTDLVRTNADPSGEYTVANVRATKGRRNGSSSAGWVLVVIYENPTETGKFISTFDGYAGLSGSVGSVDVAVNGFRTLPPPFPVRARIGVGALEGDRRIRNDRFRFRADLSAGGFVEMSTGLNPNNNFFNSTITTNGAEVSTRTPFGTNTLGTDLDLFNLNNPLNSVLPNDESGATLRFTSTGDGYGAFLATFSVEIIEPDIILEKKVEDIAGNDITGLGVNLGQTLEYVLSFRNLGNDDADSYSIRDVLPTNVTLDETNMVLPPGVTYSFDAPTQAVTFNIPNNLVEIGDPVSAIRMRVRVAENCFDFVDACTDLIENIAFSTYNGVLNSAIITDDPSVSDFDNCGFVTPGATNFLLDDLSDCNFNRTVQLCGDNVVLDAGDNFDSYVWVRDENGNEEIDPTDTVLNDGDPDNDPSTQIVTDVGVYIVDKIVADPCKGFKEIITVERFGTTQVNPIASLINDLTNSVEGEVAVCPNDGELLPKIFLCGLNDTELVQINIPDADSIEWERLDETSCAASLDDCANKDSGCGWNNVGFGNNFLASDAGEYRLIINYQNGCFTRFYFNIFKNPLDPQFNVTDLICLSPGNITVTNMPANYEFQLLDATTDAILVPYSANNGPSFTISSNGAYSVEMRQQGVLDGCIFRLEDIGVLTRDFQLDITTKDTDCNGLGEIAISALDVEPQYYYEISQGGTTIDTFGPSTDNNYTFFNLNDGVYDVLVTTDDGCSLTQQVTINDVTDLDVNAVTTKPIDCTDGIITVSGSGGFPNPNYLYAIWSYNGTDLYANVSDIPGSAFQDTSEFFFNAAQAGDYEFLVVDANNCTFVSNIATIAVAPSIEYTTSVTDETCLGGADGSYAVNVTNFNGYSASYVLTYPDTSTASNVSGTFTGLGQGNYSLTITQSNGTAICDYVETFTISGPADSVTANAVLVQDYSCLQDATLEAQNIVGGSAPYEFSIDGVNFVAGLGAETFPNLTNGTYAITVRDANGCVFVTNSVIIDPLNPPTDLTFSATEPNCPTQTSDVTATVIGGNTPFNFEIIAPVSTPASSISGNTADFDGLAPDTYTYRVTDNKGCVYEESFTINPVTPINTTGQLATNVSCFNGSDGAILFNVNGFNTTYDYSVTGPLNFNGTNETSTAIPFTNLPAGSYDITVTDNQTNCQALANVVVEEPTVPLAISYTEVQPSCTTDGSVSLSASDGWGSYTYTLTYPDLTTSLSNTTGNFNSLNQAGTYSASVTDANGCSITDTFVLNAAVSPVLDVTANDLCYDALVGLTLTASITSGGDGNFQYRINGGPYDVANVFAGLGPGTYTIDVLDGNNCTDTSTITINPELSVSASAPNITSCGTDSQVTINAAGGDGTYVYAIVADAVVPAPGDFGASNNITITGTGDYDVYVRDNNGNAGFCEAAFDINIVQDAPLSLAISNTPILCSGSMESTLTIVPSGGAAPFLFSIDNGGSYQSSPSFVNLAAGSYTARVRDANNCEISQIYTISEPLALTASAAVTELIECNPSIGAEVRITNAQGGSGTYEYSFDGGTSFVASPIGFLLPGTHTLFIRDSNNCTYPMDVTVAPEPTPPGISPVITYACDGEGNITITPDNPGYNYTYSIDGMPNTPATSAIFTDVAVGSHTITADYIISTPPSPSSLLLEDFGAGPNISITEVDPAYCYEPQDGSVNSCGWAISDRIQDGEYSVTQLIVRPYGSWRSPNDHSAVPNGRFLAMNVGGAVGPNGIIYAKRDIEVLPNRDITISLWAFNLLRVGTGGADPDINIQLVDGGGTVIASTTTGNIPKNNNANDWQNYTVTLNPGAINNLDIVIRTNSAVTGGNDIAIDDIEAFQIPEVCPSTVSIDVVVEDGNAFDASITSFVNISCNGLSDGELTFDVENFDAINGFEYSVNGGSFSAPQTASPIIISGLSAGVNTIEVRDVLDNSCSVILSETLLEPSLLVASALITEVATCSNAGATITASAIGGTPSYQYQLEDTLGAILSAYSTNAVFTGLPTGDYIIRVLDTNSCEDPIDSAISVVAPQAITFTSTPTACYSGINDASIQVDVTLGNGEYQFSLNSGPWLTPSPSNATTYTFNGLSDGNYTIDVRDQFGCVGIQQSLTIHPNLSVTIDVIDISSCADGTITANATGGNGAYEYAFVPTGNSPSSAFSTTNTFAVSAGNEGDFDVYVRDNSAIVPFCENMQTVSVLPANPLVFTTTPTDPECHDGTGSIEVTITGGDGPFTYEIIDLDNGGASNETNNNILSTTRSYFNLLPGNYTINVTDAFGCMVSDSPILINNPDELTADISGVLPAACGSVDPNDYGFRFTNYPTTLGTIEFSADGGATWTGDNSAPGTSDVLTGYFSGVSVFPSMRTVDGLGNTVCQTDLPRYVIPYPLDDLDITISTVVVNCNDLQVTVQGTQGVPNYEYAYTDDPSTFNPLTAAWTAPVPLSHTWTALIPGKTYVFYVRDSSGCIRQSNVNVNDITTNPIEITASYEPSCFGSNDAEITYTLTDTDGNIEPSMRWEFYNVATGALVTSSGGNIPYSPTITVNGLAPAEYYIVVTEVDALNVDNCVSGSENILIEELDQINASLSKVQDITCNAPGIISVDNVIGGGGIYTYTVTGPVGFTTISNTPDNPIEIAANSPAGDYFVRVEDQFGCFSDFGPINLLLSPNPTIDAIAVENCSSDPSLTITASSTAAQILYSNDGGLSYADNGGVFTNVTPGTYNISIIDSNGCSDTAVVEVYPVLEASVNLTKLIDCSLSPNGEITIEVTAGSNDYDFEIAGPVNEARTSLTANPFVWNLASAPGTYTITVYDNNTSGPECNRVFTVEVPASITPTFTETHLDVSCNGANDGSITLTETDNGISPLSYTILPVAGTFNAATNSFENLPPNNYTITATGTNGCTFDISGIIIGEPGVITLPAPTIVEFSCVSGNNNSNATISIDNTLISGGSGSYVVYEFINNQGTAPLGDDVVLQLGGNSSYTETNPLGGSYTINVYDSNGCLGSTTGVILPYDELLTATAAITNPISCNPGLDGEISITATSINNDPTRFEYSIDNGLNYQASNVFSGLDIGTYNFMVRHLDTGCIITTSEVLEDPNTFNIVVDKLQDVICFGTSTGEVTFELVDATYPGGFDWEVWDTNGTAVNIADDISILTGNEAGNGPSAVVNLPAGSYYVEISQTNNPSCVNIEAFSINGPSQAITANVNLSDITCLGNDGILEVIDAAGGWGGYSYYVGVVSPTGPGDYLVSPRFENLTAGTYEAWVIDQNGCEQLVQNGIVLADPAPITASLQVNQENCTNLEGELEVVGTTGGQNANYSYQLIKDSTPFGAPQTTTVFTGLGAGSYEVVITDQWACTATIGPEVLYEEMNLVSTLVKPLDCTINPDGEITITVTGGSLNLDYTVTYPDGITTSSNNSGVFVGLDQAGLYDFVVTDLDTTNPVCTKTISTELIAPSIVAFDPHDIVDVSCNGLSDGSISIVLSASTPGTNDNPIYQYNLYDNLGVLIAGPQASPTFNGLSAGTYEVEAVSARGCSLREAVTVGEPLALVVSANATAFSCSPANVVSTSTLSVSVTPGTGTAPYLYSIDNVNFQSSSSFEVVDTGVVQNITVYVSDANGCTETDLVSISPINTFSALVSQNIAISCANPEEVLISVTDDGNPGNTYTFELLPLANPNGTLTSNPTNTSAIFDLSAAGSYTFRITDTTTGCYVDTAPYEILPFDLITVASNPVSQVSCFGGADGALEITISGYTGAYDYEVFDAAGVTTGITGSANTSTNPLSIIGLSGGNYFVRVRQTANPLCVEDSDISTIISPDMPLTAIVSPLANVSCSNDQGEIIVTPSGGYGPYDIVLTNNTTTQTYTVTGVNSNVFTGLSAGNFDVEITDNGGCIINEVETLILPMPITAGITATPTNLVCFGDTNASVSAINTLGGEGTYQYQLNYYDPTGTTIDFSSGGQLSPTFDNLGAGVYSITISDNWSCGIETAQVTITEPSDVSSNLIQLSGLTCIDQAELELSATGGTGPYEFSLDGTSFTAFDFGNTHVFTVPDGNYQYYVRDSFGCEASISNQISVDPLIPLTINLDETAAIINCTGEATATIIAEARGGLGNYSYELFGDATLTNLIAGPQTSNTFNMLASGSYFIRVSSGDCIEVSTEVIITEPLPLQVVREEFTDVTCAGQNDGTITVEVSGGTGTIQYAISPFLNQFDTENTFEDLEPGVYDVIAQDESGCFIPFQFTIIEPSPLAATFTALPEVCIGNEDGEIQLTISGGTAPYSTAFNSNSASDYILDQVQFNNLAAGTYVIFIQDAMGCETNVIVEIEPGVNINALVEPIYECTDNFLENSLEITLEDPTVLGSVMYALDSTDPADMVLDPDFSNITPGNHYLAIAHANGCVLTIDFEIQDFEPLTISLEQQNLNEITAIATGGLEDYTFYFDGVDNGNDNTYYINRTDTYTVIVVDENGCETSAEIFMEFIDIEIPNFFTPDGDGLNDTWVPRNIEQFPEILTVVFDRYGREVYRMGYGDAGWNGLYQGSELPTGDYWYVIKLKGEVDDREFVGHFTLYR